MSVRGGGAVRQTSWTTCGWKLFFQMQEPDGATDPSKLRFAPYGRAGRLGVTRLSSSKSKLQISPNAL